MEWRIILTLLFTKLDKISVFLYHWDVVYLLELHMIMGWINEKQV